MERNPSVSLSVTTRRIGSREGARHHVHGLLQLAIELPAAADFQLVEHDLLDLRLAAARLYDQLREAEEG